MPIVYFVAAGLGVLIATVLAAAVKIDLRRAMSGQLPLRPDAAVQQKESDHTQQPAAMVSTGRLTL